VLRVLLMVLGVAAASTAPVAAQRPAPAGEGPVIITSGEGLVKKVADRAWVSISAESRARSPRDAQRANADAMTAVLARLKGAGLPGDAIRTSGYDLQPEFDYANGKQTLRGYVARNSLEVRADDITRVGDILDLAVGAGATSVTGVRFDLKDRVDAEREALRRAVADARGRAEAAAAGAGVTIDRIMRIEEQRAFVQEPRPMMMKRESMVADSAETPITPGELDVRALVTLTTAIH
jgi:uncharacterized protein YggE